MSHKRKREETEFSIDPDKVQRAIDSCKRGKWLVDDAINFYIFHLNRRLRLEGDSRFVIFNTYFWTLLSNKKSIKRLLRWNDNAKLWKASYWLIPAHIDYSHWCLFIFCVPSDLQSAKDVAVYVLDSLYKQSVYDMCKHIRRFIHISWKLNNPGKKLSADAMLQPKQLQVPTQKNNSDCGIYLLLYIRGFVKCPIDSDHPKWFGREGVISLRDRLRSALIRCYTTP